MNIERYTEEYIQARIRWLQAATPLLESKNLLINAYMRYHYPGVRYNKAIEANDIQFDFPDLPKEQAQKITEEITQYFDQADQQVEDYFTRLMNPDK